MKIGILGAGTMGSGIAQVAAQNEHENNSRGCKSRNIKQSGG